MDLQHEPNANKNIWLSHCSHEMNYYCRVSMYSYGLIAKSARARWHATRMMQTTEGKNSFAPKSISNKTDSIRFHARRGVVQRSLNWTRRGPLERENEIFNRMNQIERHFRPSYPIADAKPENPSYVGQQKTRIGCVGCHVKE
jgi:hypothetical protein